jgi:radical SAM protein with 4Fe4S-binding SPASM domain
MQFSDWQHVLQEAAHIGCQRVQFIGGEPTTYPYLIQLIRQATALAMHVEVYTNLVSIKPAHWETFQSCHVRLATSFYSLDPHVHAQITQSRSSHQKTIQNIQYALDRHIPIRVGMVEMRPDQQIEETKQYLQDLGVQHIGIDQVRSVGRGSAYGMESHPEDALCGACARGKAAVMPNGDVYPCVFSRWLRIGNIHHEQSLREIVSGSAMQLTRDHLNSHFQHRFGHRCIPQCDPHTCDPNCEPGECAPDAPDCDPTRLCIPDFKDPCNPEAPCSPDKEECSPDWNKQG